MEPQAGNAWLISDAHTQTTLPPTPHERLEPGGLRTQNIQPLPTEKKPQLPGLLPTLNAMGQKVPNSPMVNKSFKRLK